MDVSSHEGFQSEERDIVLIMMTRERTFRALNDKYLMSVALTRAKKCLIICGCFGVAEKSSDWESLLEDAMERGHLFVVDNKEYNDEDFLEKIVKS